MDIMSKEAYDSSAMATTPSFQNMSLRDYFAAHCPESEIERRMGKTIGEVKDALVKYGRIRGRIGDHYGSADYNNDDKEWLRIRLRYAYADDMLKMRDAV